MILATSKKKHLKIILIIFHGNIHLLTSVKNSFDIQNVKIMRDNFRFKVITLLPVAVNTMLMSYR